MKSGRSGLLSVDRQQSLCVLWRFARSLTPTAKSLTQRRRSPQSEKMTLQTQCPNAVCRQRCHLSGVCKPSSFSVLILPVCTGPLMARSVHPRRPRHFHYPIPIRYGPSLNYFRPAGSNATVLVSRLNSASPARPYQPTAMVVSTLSVSNQRVQCHGDRGRSYVLPSRL